jgi:membrane protein DedA with SNARE-associated domain
MTEANKDFLKHAIVSILVGALVAGLSALLEGLLGLLKHNFVDFKNARR